MGITKKAILTEHFNKNTWVESNAKMILAYAPTQMADKAMHIFHAVWSEEFSNNRQTDTDPRREWESVWGGNRMKLPPSNCI